MYNSNILRSTLCFVFCFSLLGAFAQKRIVDKIVGQVGNHIVLLSELESQYQYEMSKNPGVGPEVKCSILEGLLVEKLLLTHAELDSVVITDDQVEAQLDARMNQILSMMNNDEDRLQQFYGQSRSQLKNRVRTDMKERMMIQTKQQSVIQSVGITPREVIELYNSIPTDSLPLFNSEVEFAEIIVSPVPNAEEKEKAKAKLEGLKLRIENGEKFEEIARVYSDDTGSARQGGDLGMTSRGMLVSEYEAASFALEEGEISPIIESMFGFHLIQLIERRGNNYRTRHVLITPEITASDRQLSIDILKNARQEVMNDSITFAQAVKEYGDSEAESFNNGGRVRNGRTGNTFFQVGDLDLEPDIYFALDTMEVGDISAPIEFRMPNGDRFYRIIKFQSKTEPHRASLDQDYSKILEIAKANKKNAALAEWIEEKIVSTYIKMDPAFHACPNFARWNIDKAKP